ncbi:PREDICTED: CAS1 domain-containing protein 1-like [Acropora digitifera]|uniref:CAS1 domain-containing protein 1-like n=1 Tax=Acropora digitifera TaxID=70779 RepID=UPI00077B0439|nr:PREDICTED: CAS1 domain-containing protein 1-like [Acropora digitifera]
MARFTGESMALVIPSMAVEPSELSCSNSMDLSDNEKKSKEHDDRGKESAMQWPGSSRVEKLCKTLAFLIVFCVFCVHLARVLREGSDTCPKMFHFGRWRESFWQPHGCMMHSYTNSELRTCLHNRHVAFVGDSRTRGLYYHLVHGLSSNAVKDEGKAHKDLSYSEMASNASVLINSTTLMATTTIGEEGKSLQNPDKSPHLIITGSGTWTIKNQAQDAVINYGYNLTKVKRSMERLVAKKQSENQKQMIKKKTNLFPPSPVIIWIQQEPVVKHKLNEARKIITNEKIELFNFIASEIFPRENTSVIVMWASFYAALKRPQASEDGLHYGQEIISLELDLIFNYYCNQYLQVSDATCCVPAPRLTHLQNNTFAVFITWSKVQVLTRMNILVAVLCLAMGRPYQFYYFVPLITFWFALIYAVLAAWPKVTAAVVKENKKLYFPLLVKLFLLFAGITIIWSSPLLCQWIFSQWAIKELFVDENDSVREWWFRSWLDRYIALCGMLISLAYCSAKDFRLIDDNNKKILFSKPVGVVCVIFSFVTLVGYTLQAFTCTSKVSCNETHSVASFIPITAFVLLRNVPGSLRSKFSKFYAWIGSISLELFIAQYHIWLAHDTKGVLVLIPDQPLLNVVLTTFVFVCVSHEIHKVTGVLANALISRDIKTMTRRVCFFIFMLIIIWWHKTHHIPKPKLA